MYTTTTNLADFSSLDSSVVVQLRPQGSGQVFSCTLSSNLAISQSCGNGFINTSNNEQCELHNGNVIVRPGLTFDPATQACVSCQIRTTTLRNCATMTVDGIDKVSCVDLQAQPENPLLTIIKYVNNQDANTSSTAVSVQAGNTLDYKVVITNNSQFTAHNVVFHDVIPAGVTYVPGSVSPTTISYNTATNTLSGSLGTIAPGASREVIFRVIVNTNAPSSVTNTAFVNYTDHLGNIKPQLSDPAVIVV